MKGKRKMRGGRGKENERGKEGEGGRFVKKKWLVDYFNYLYLSF